MAKFSSGRMGARPPPPVGLSRRPRPAANQVPPGPGRKPPFRVAAGGLEGGAKGAVPPGGAEGGGLGGVWWGFGSAHQGITIRSGGGVSTPRSSRPPRCSPTTASGSPPSRSITRSIGCRTPRRSPAGMPKPRPGLRSHSRHPGASRTTPASRMWMDRSATFSTRRGAWGRSSARSSFSSRRSSRRTWTD